MYSITASGRRCPAVRWLCVSTPPHPTRRDENYHGELDAISGIASQGSDPVRISPELMGCAGNSLPLDRCRRKRPNAVLNTDKLFITSNLLIFQNTPSNSLSLPEGTEYRSPRQPRQLPRHSPGQASSDRWGSRYKANRPSAAIKRASLQCPLQFQQGSAEIPRPGSLPISVSCLRPQPCECRFHAFAAHPNRQPRYRCQSRPKKRKSGKD